MSIEERKALYSIPVLIALALVSELVMEPARTALIVGAFLVLIGVWVWRMQP